MEPKGREKELMARQDLLEKLLAKLEGRVVNLEAGIHAVARAGYSSPGSTVPGPDKPKMETRPSPLSGPESQERPLGANDGEDSVD